MPGSIPATSQLDWLISTTAMIVLSWSRATRDLLKACPSEGRGRSAGASGHSISWLQRRWCHFLAACPIPSLSWREVDSNFRFRARLHYGRSRVSRFTWESSSPAARPRLERAANGGSLGLAPERDPAASPERAHRIPATRKANNRRHEDARQPFAGPMVRILFPPG